MRLSKDAHERGKTQHPGAHGEAPGLTSWKYKYSAAYKWSAPERVKGDGFKSEAETTSVTVTATITVDTPKWEGYDAAKPEEQQKWDEYGNSLKDHEEGHVEIATKGATEVGKAILDTSATGNGKTPQQAINNAKANIKSAQDQNDRKAETKVAEQSREYDKKTDMGRIPREE